MLLLVLILGGLLYSNEIDMMKLLTEEYPPYNYTENGIVIGIAPDLMEEMLKKLDTKLTQKDIKVYPWARGYLMALKEKNTVLFAMTKTSAREKLFKWVGPIIENHNILMAKKEKNIKINSFEDINKYEVGVVRNDIAEQLLLSNGVYEKNLQEVANVISNLKKLNVDRVDLIGYTEIALKWVIKKNKYNLDDYEIVFNLTKEPSSLYFAFNKDTSDEIIEKFQNVLDEVKKEGTYDNIILKYTGNSN